MERNYPFEYQQRSEKQLKQKFYALKTKGSNFVDFQQFKKWYESQTKVCHYCGITEAEVQEIVKKGFLTSARFPQQNGKPIRGQNRGIYLEIDRKDNSKGYSEQNCVLACYFCNNDKSDIFSYEQYKEFLTNRAKFLKRLLADRSLKQEVLK